MRRQAGAIFLLVIGVNLIVEPNAWLSALGAALLGLFVGLAIPQDRE